jgi:hypothetical protein
MLHKVHKAGPYYDYIQFHVNIIDLLNSEVEHRLQNKLSGEVFFPVADKLRYSEAASL